MDSPSVLEIPEGAQGREEYWREQSRLKREEQAFIDNKDNPQMQREGQRRREQRLAQQAEIQASFDRQDQDSKELWGTQLAIWNKLITRGQRNQATAGGGPVARTGSNFYNPVMAARVGSAVNRKSLIGS